MPRDKSIIASLSISGEITLNLHSLNNEGGEGNQTMTRQVTVVDNQGEIHTVNAISGDMFKHIHASHLSHLAKERNLPLSKYAQELNPNRIAKIDFEDYFKNTPTNKNESAADIISAMINICTICDTHGILITDKIGDNKNSSNTPRKSSVEFGWTVGIPNKTNTETFIHTKLVSNSSGVRGQAGNEGQNIFHRPANYGVYAVVCSIDVYRIGFNDISREYNIDDSSRADRYKALLQSLLSTFINPKGAMSSTQKPHITDFKGVVTTSNTLIPSPTISSLNDNYIEEIKKISSNLNKIEEDAINVSEFNGLGELSGIFADLINNKKPYKIG